MLLQNAKREEGELAYSDDAHMYLPWEEQTLDANRIRG